MQTKSFNCGKSNVKPIAELLQFMEAYYKQAAVTVPTFG